MDRLLTRVPAAIRRILDGVLDDVVVKGRPSALSTADAATLLGARGSAAVAAVAAAADACRAAAPCGDVVTYVVNRNINFTNACVKKCGFCAFSRTGVDEEAYFLPLEEIVRRAREAAALGATEVCIQAGLPPAMDKDLYTTVAAAVRQALPDIHLHAFSPEEVLYGAKRRGVPVADMIRALKDAGVNTLPGTSAEILDDTVRARLAKGRLTTAEWRHVIGTAHSLGVPTTSTVMYGHVESPLHVAAHIALVRDIHATSMAAYGVGITEFVPLSFVAREAPMWRARAQGPAAARAPPAPAALARDDAGSGVGETTAMRAGPTGREVVLTHAVARLMLAGHIDNIQVSWVKEGFRMAQTLLDAGVNDLGGTLMNESISTAAGAGHGQLATPSDLRGLIHDAGRVPAQRRTDYSRVRVFAGADGEAEGGSAEGEALDRVADAAAAFGSFDQLRAGKDHRYTAYHKKEARRGVATLARPARRGFSTVAAAAAAAAPAAAPAPAAAANPDPAVVTYSSSYTLVPTHECFNSCSYCNFRTNVRSDDGAMLPLERARTILEGLRDRAHTAPAAAAAGGEGGTCIDSDGRRVDEILILSGEIHPRSARRASWHRRIVDLCKLALELGFLPHTNAGPLSYEEMEELGHVNASMGLMLEQSTPVLLTGVHRFAPHKAPALRLDQLKQAGELRIPFTTGVLLGVGEGRDDHRHSFHAIAALARQYNHIQEVILQPYSPAGDPYARSGAAGFPLRDLPGVVAMAREILPPEVVIQIPPNLVLDRKHGPDCGVTDAATTAAATAVAAATEAEEEAAAVLQACLAAGARDLGGVSPVDEVNRTYAFPPAEVLRRRVEGDGTPPAHGTGRATAPAPAATHPHFVLRRRLPVHDRLLPLAFEKPPVARVLRRMGY